MKGAQRRQCQLQLVHPSLRTITLLQTPRPERPPLRLLLQAVEDLEVSVDGAKCDEIADGSAEQMHKLSAALVAVGSIASNLAADVVPAVTTLVEMLAE